MDKGHANNLQPSRIILPSDGQAVTHPTYGVYETVMSGKNFDLVFEYAGEKIQFHNHTQIMDSLTLEYFKPYQLNVCHGKQEDRPFVGHIEYYPII